MFARFLVSNVHSSGNRANPSKCEWFGSNMQKNAKVLGCAIDFAERTTDQNEMTKWEWGAGRCTKRSSLYLVRGCSPSIFHFARYRGYLQQYVVSELWKLPNEVKHYTVIAQKARKLNFSYSALPARRLIFAKHDNMIANILFQFIASRSGTE